MNKEEFERRRAEIRAKSNKLWEDIEAHRAEEKRTIHVLQNAQTILDKLDTTFEQRTSLSHTDNIILMLATAMQLIRIYVLPKLKSKSSDQNKYVSAAKRINDVGKLLLNGTQETDSERLKPTPSKLGYRNWQEIAFTKKIPYEANLSSALDFSRNRYSGPNHIKPLGHDPILGWIFGVANILTDTITIIPESQSGYKTILIPSIESYKVDMGYNFRGMDRIPTSCVIEDSIESIKEDQNRLYAALFAHGFHLASDKFAKLGLQRPYLCKIDSDSAYRIFKKGYDHLNYLNDTELLKTALKSAKQSIMINMLIGAIHTLFFNPCIDHDQQLYNVRTRKIILYSNLIATTSDVVQTAVRAYNGDDNAIKDFDLGGFLVTLYRLITDTSYIQSIKEEFIYSEWDKIIESKNNIFNI